MFHKKSFIFLANLLGLLMATTASAAVDGVYLGGQLGWGSVGNPDYVDNYNNKTNDTGVAGRVFGGYQLSQNIGLELGFTKFANLNTSGTYYIASIPFNTSGTVQTYATDLVGKLILPLPNGFSVFGKLGIAYLNEQWSLSSSATSISASGTEDGFLPTFGLGAGYDFNKNITADVTWMRIQQTGSINLGSTDTVMVGVSYHFG